MTATGNQLRGPAAIAPFALPLSAFVALFLTSCSPTNNHTLLVVNVQNNLAVAEIDEIVIIVQAGASMLSTRSFAADRRVQLGVRPKGAPGFNLEVTALGRLKGQTLVTQTAGPVGFVAGTAKQFTLVLDRACAAPQTCADAAQTCRAGQCVPRGQIAMLFDYPGDPPGIPDGGVLDGSSAGHDGGPGDGAARDAPVLKGSWTSSAAPNVPGQTTLSSVWPIAADDVWAVGYLGTGGVAFHFDGATWSSVSLPAALMNKPLYAVWAAAPDDVWAVGFAGTILHRSATGPVLVASGSQATLTGVWGSSAADVWAVGSGGTVLHWDGMVWNRVATGIDPTVNLLSITGSGADDLWAVGTAGGVFRGSSNGWQQQKHGLTVTTLFGVWAGSSTDVWAVGAGAALHLRGTAWSLTRDTPDTASAAWGSGDDDVWAVGALATKNGPVTHFDGNAWSAIASPVKPSASLQSVRGLSATDVWAVGTNATIVHFHAP